MTIQSFHPTQRTLMGPGPSDVSPRILEALNGREIKAKTLDVSQHTGIIHYMNLPS